ncbi:SWR1-complex protein 4 [Xylariaceae sp. FL0594]|nr:SWR1-complex protein 4 [Xylariaceae sp. FL0594]
MASHDVRDVLNLPADATGLRALRKPKPAAPRPNLKGLAREVQSLGGDNPIAIVPEISRFKKRRLAWKSNAARWHMSPFRNSARDDDLQLRHWTKESADKSRSATQSQPDDPMAGENTAESEKKADEPEDSGFAKFNVKVDVPQYNDDQYNSNLASDDWSRDETDYLFDTARAFDLRWPLIWDRYDYTPKLPDHIKGEEGADSSESKTALIPAPKPRSMEDLKRRYYEVAAKMMAVQKPVQYMTQAEFSLHEMMANFSPVIEMQRKKFAQDALTRSKEEALEEEQLLIEVRRIVNRQQKLNQERQDLYRRLDYPPAEQDIGSFKSSAGLATLLQNLMNADKSKKRKSIMEAASGNTPSSAQAQAQPSSTPAPDSRRDSIAASTSGRRDSVAGSERPERPSKKGAQSQERKKLTEQEEQIYGVSHHDRLPSGPTFRYDRINKILTTKSNAQHQRITNTLAELDVPARLTMPTRAVVEQMEKLLHSINTLLEIRKVNDKIDGELRLEQAKLAERRNQQGQGPGPGQGQANGEERRPSTAQGRAALHPTEGGQLATPQSSSANGDASGPDTEPYTATTTNGGSGSGSETSGQVTNGTPGAGANSTGTEGLDDKIKTEASDNNRGTDGTKSSSSRPGSSGGNGVRKRSASVLSGVSDKSAKRLKKVD